MMPRIVTDELKRQRQQLVLDNLADRIDAMLRHTPLEALLDAGFSEPDLFLTKRLAGALRKGSIPSDLFGIAQRLPALLDRVDSKRKL